MAVDGNGSGAGPSHFRITPTIKRRAQRHMQSINRSHLALVRGDLSVQPK